MSNNIIPFTSTGTLPSAIVNRQRRIDVNKDIVTTQPFPSLSIKGKVFTLVQDNERKVLTRPDDPEEVVQAINVAMLRINMHAKTYYAKRFTEDESEGQRPDCYSMDGIAPAATAPNKQAAKCALCPHNVWGSRVSDDNTGKGKACADNARIAVADPTNLDRPMLLRVPPASLRPLKDALKMVKQRGIQYNEVIFRVGFDKESASPKLTFRPVGVLDDAGYERACELFDSEIVRAIVGADDAESASTEVPTTETNELDAALAAREATRKAAAAQSAKTAAKPPVVPAEEPETAAKPAAKPAKTAPKATKAAPPPAAPAEPAEPADGDSLLGDLSALLGNLDD